MTALPGEALGCVVARPDVVGRQSIDTARVGDEVAGSHLRPRADPHAVGLRHRPVSVQEGWTRLPFGPPPLLKGSLELGVVGLADEATGLMVKGRIEEEAVVL